MKIDDELLTAYLDGELDSKARVEVERQLELSPALAERLEKLQQTDQRLKQGYQSIDQRPMPESVLKMLEDFPATQETSANILSFPNKNRSVARTPVWQIAAAASVALVIGIGIGRSLFLPETSSPGQSMKLAEVGTGPVQTDSALFAMLENQPSAEPVTFDGESGTVATPLMSFQNKNGDYCRDFSVTTKTQGTRAVACKGNHQWTVQVAVATAGYDTGNTGTYQTASQTATPVIDSAIQKMIDGDALGMEQEKKAIRAHWNRD